MGKLVVSEFVSLDGVIEDPGGAEGTRDGGWSFRFPAPDGMQFKFEELLASDVQLLGRVTYEEFAAAWPGIVEQRQGLIRPVEGDVAGGDRANDRLTAGPCEPRHQSAPNAG